MEFVIEKYLNRQVQDILVNSIPPGLCHVIHNHGDQKHPCLGRIGLRITVQCNVMCTLVYQIEVHVHLLILRKNFPLHDLVLVCSLIDFEKKITPVHLLESH